MELRSDYNIDLMKVLIKVLKQNEMGGRTLVMDNGTIHKTRAFIETITNQGLNIMYLPCNSPSSNPIHNLWFKLKVGVRTDLLREDTILLTLIDSAIKITAEDCQTWIEQSI